MWKKNPFTMFSFNTYELFIFWMNPRNLLKQDETTRRLSAFIKKKKQFIFLYNTYYILYMYNPVRIEELHDQRRPCMTRKRRFNENEWSNPMIFRRRQSDYSVRCPEKNAPPPLFYIYFPPFIFKTLLF